MSQSYTLSETTTFTVTHAKHIAAKVATDLKRLQRLYGQPDDARIAKYEAEATALLKAGYLGTVTYGYRRNGQWIEPTLRFTARDLAETAANDDVPGKVRPGANISGASFYSYLRRGTRSNSSSCRSYVEMRMSPRLAAISTTIGSIRRAGAP